MAAKPRVAVGRAPRSLRSLVRPPLNGSIVGQTKMWAMLSDIDCGDLYEKWPAADFRPMKPVVAALRLRPYADRVSAFTSHAIFVVTPALDYAEADRFDSVTVDYSPRSTAFTISYLKRQSGASDKAVVFTLPEVVDRVDALVQRLMTESEVTRTNPPDG